MIQKLLIFAIVLSLLLSGCNLPGGSFFRNPGGGETSLTHKTALPQRLPTSPVDSATGDDNEENKPPPPTPTPTVLPSPTPTPEPQPLGPASFPPGVNPLTGLPVSNPENLSLPPALVSITNFPVSARPQAGLSFTPFVFEMYIGEGASRFLALFYGDYPVRLEQPGSDPEDQVISDGIGPIRSGRLPYEPLRKHYNGFLVMASAASMVSAQLSQVSNIFGSDNDNINSAMIGASKLEQIARSQSKSLDLTALSGLYFDAAAPAGGAPAKMIWLPYSYKNQIIWRHNPESGGYNRYQDNADGKTFIQASDRLNGEPLNYENVVILFAEHRAHYETVIDIQLSYVNRMPALLFRDGTMHEIFWTTRNEEYERTTGKIRPIRFIDANGNPFPLKPGQTWVQFVPLGTRYDEVIESEHYFDLKTKRQPGSGVWAIRFFAPPLEN